MLTSAARRSDHFTQCAGDAVHTRIELVAMGCSDAQITSRLAARRWRRVGRAIVLHNGPLTPGQCRHVAVINCGPGAQLASFTAAQAHGLTGWERPEIHILGPAGVARPPRVPEFHLVLHRTASPLSRTPDRRQPMADALVLAAAGFASARPACGILAAGVQQRLISAGDLSAALARAPRTRHRRALTHAVADIAMGAEALSEIDFARLCRRHGLPEPLRQAIRLEPGGRRRYLDAEWTGRAGRRVVVEVDGAVHLTPRTWYDDQLRQNELVLSGSVVLRFPSVIVRTEEALVAAQLRRALS